MSTPQVAESWKFQETGTSSPPRSPASDSCPQWVCSLPGLDRFLQLGYEDLLSSKPAYLHNPSRTGFLRWDSRLKSLRRIFLWLRPPHIGDFGLQVTPGYPD